MFSLNRFEESQSSELTRLRMVLYLRANAHFHGYAVENDRPKVEELYDLTADLGERNNLAQKHPELVAELRALTEKLESKK